MATRGSSHRKTTRYLACCYFVLLLLLLLLLLLFCITRGSLAVAYHLEFVALRPLAFTIRRYSQVTCAVICGTYMLDSEKWPDWSLIRTFVQHLKKPITCDNFFFVTHPGYI